MDCKVDPLSQIPQDSVEKFYIPYYFSNDTTKYFGTYPGETIISLTKTTKRRTRIGFGVATNDAFFYGLRYFDLEELRNVKLTALQTDLKIYNDILVIDPDTSSQKWSKRDHYILRIYWSKSNGLVRYDKNNNIQYTLTKKIRPITLGLAQAACVPARPLKAEGILWACAVSLTKFMRSAPSPGRSPKQPERIARNRKL